MERWNPRENGWAPDGRVQRQWAVAQDSNDTYQQTDLAGSWRGHGDVRAGWLGGGERAGCALQYCRAVCRWGHVGHARAVAGGGVRPVWRARSAGCAVYRWQTVGGAAGALVADHHGRSSLADALVCRSRGEHPRSGGIAGSGLAVAMGNPGPVRGPGPGSGDPDSRRRLGVAGDGPLLPQAPGQCGIRRAGGGVVSGRQPLRGGGSRRHRQSD